MIEQEEVEALKAKHGDLTRVALEDVTILLRKPTRAEFKAFRLAAQNDARRGNATEELAKRIVVYPGTVQELEAVFDRFPALEDVVSGEAVKLAGGGATADVKKL